MGDGRSIDIRKDRWLVSANIIEELPNLPYTRVNELLDPSNSGWDISKVREHFSPVIAIKIIQTPVQWSGGSDALWWPATKSGDFWVKTGTIQQNKYNREWAFNHLGPTWLILWFGRRFGMLRRLKKSRFFSRRHVITLCL